MAKRKDKKPSLVEMLDEFAKEEEQPWTKYGSMGELVDDACLEFSDKVMPKSLAKRLNHIACVVWNLNKDNQKNVKEVLDKVHPPFRFGMKVSIFVVLFFFVWGSFAPLDSAAIAPGTITLLSNKKTVQHLEGGIIEEILIKEGDVVASNQPLIKLNHASPQARQSLLEGQYYTAKAMEDRLIAERDSEPQVLFSDELLAEKGDDQVDKVIDSQLKIFRTRRNSQEGQINILNQRIAQYNDQIKGLEAQIRAADIQLSLKNEEIESVKVLLEKGLEKRPRFLGLKQQEAALEGQKGDHMAQIARVRESIIETSLQIESVKNDAMREVLAELKQTQDQIADLQEQLYASRDVLSRTIIVAPQSGVVTGLQFHTVGGVIGPGEPLMDIVPQDDQLVVEAKVQPTDIDIVRKGLDAKVMLSAYKSRTVPKLKGVVTDISADKFVDDQSGEAYYKAHVAIDEQELGSLQEEVELYPGMPADVFIVTGESTLLNYLSDPITGTFNRAFKEQ